MAPLGPLPQHSHCVRELSSRPGAVLAKAETWGLSQGGSCRRPCGQPTGRRRWVKGLPPCRLAGRESGSAQAAQSFVFFQ